MAKKIANKTDNVALQGANVLAAQAVTSSPLALQPSVTDNKSSLELAKSKKQSEEANLDTQSYDVPSAVLSDSAVSIDMVEGVVQSGDVILAQASGSGSSGASSGAAAGAGASGISTTALIVGGVAVAAAASSGSSSSSSAAVAATYAVAGSTSAAEGTNTVFTVTTTGVAAGTKLQYTITGTGNASSLNNQSGEVTVDSNGKAYITLAVPANSTVGDTGTLKVTLSNGTASNSVTTTDATSPASQVLTTGIDAYTGTTAADTFTATNSTFTALDSLDGGTGSDTLNISDVTATPPGRVKAAAPTSISPLSTISVHQVPITVCLDSPA